MKWDKWVHAKCGTALETESDVPIDKVGGNGYSVASYGRLFCPKCKTTFSKQNDDEIVMARDYFKKCQEQAGKKM